MGLKAGASGRIALRMMALEPWQWALAIVAALIVGISKSGIGGLGVLAVVIFALIMPAKQATGTVLPLLCFFSS